MNIGTTWNRAVCGAVVLAFLIVAAPDRTAWAAGGNPNPRVLPPYAYPFGKSYGDWTAEWWKWNLRLPATDHPAFSLDGVNCDTGQSGKVWFLAGAFTTEVPAEFNTIVRENCTVPVGKAIFFPIINVECSTIEDAPFLLIETGPDKNIETCAARFVGEVENLVSFEDLFAVASDLEVWIDGAALEGLDRYRFQSPVFTFTFDNPDDNILAVDCAGGACENPRSVSDGHWIMLAPLSVGAHTIRFSGSFREPVTNELFFGLDVTYMLDVVSRGR